MKITQFDQTNLKTLRDDVNAALAAVAEKYGISINCGNASFTPNNATFKLGMAIAGADGTAVTPEVERFDKFASLVGLLPEHRGREITVGGLGGTFKIYGLKKTIDSRCPIIVTRVGDGQQYCITVDAAKRAVA